jgi:hypothetical protein
MAKAIADSENKIRLTGKELTNEWSRNANTAKGTALPTSNPHECLATCALSVLPRIDSRAA